MFTRNHILLGAALAVAAAAGVAPAAPPRVRVLGTEAITPERAAALMTAAGFPHERGVRALQEAYLSEGYLFVRCDVRTESDSSFTVEVAEGSVARIRSARAAGTQLKTEADVLRALRLVPGGEFVPSRLGRDIERLLGDYDRAGYPFAQVWVDSVGVYPQSGEVDVSLFVLEGVTRDIQTVLVEGLRKTQPARVARIAGITPGTPYRAQVLEDAYLRLVASGVFTEVTYPTVRVSAGGLGVDAVLRVEEAQRSHSFAAAIGYASAEEGRDRTLSGLVQLSLNNIGGTLKDFGAVWLGDGEGRTETRIRYKDRLFLGRRLALGLRLEQVGQDTLYTWQSAGIDVERGMGRVAGTLLGVSAGAFADRNVFSSGPLLRSLRVRGRLGVSTLVGSERSETFVRLAAAGTLAAKDVTYREGASGPADVTQTIGEATVEVLVPAFWSLRYALTAYGASLETDEESVPLSEQFYLGGARTVRGYRENQFHGRRIAYARNELRLGRRANEGFYVFGDAGYVLQEQALTDGSTTLSATGLGGVGFGVRSLSRVGRVDLSFAVSDEVSLQATKVHVLLEQNF